MDILKIIKDNLPDDVNISDKMLGIIVKEIKSAQGDEFVPKTDYRKKTDAIIDLEKQISELKNNGTDVEAYKSKVEELEAKVSELEKTHKEALGLKDKEFSEYKTTVETENATAAKKSILLKQLSADGANPKLISLLEKEFDLSKVELDGDKIKDWDSISKSVKEQYADIFTFERKKDFEPGKKSPVDESGGDDEFNFSFTPVRQAEKQ